MRRVILTSSILVCLICASYGQYIKGYEVKKNIIQSFPIELASTIIVKIEDQVTIKVWELDMVSVETSLIPVKACYRAVEILVDTGDYHVLTFNSSDKMLIYDNPNNGFVYFKDKAQLFRVEYTIHVPIGVKVMDVYRNDLVNNTFAKLNKRQITSQD